MDEQRQTVGKLATDLMQKEAPTTDPIELEREMHKPYEDHVYDCIARGKQEFVGNFYIVVITKKERLLQNVIRNYFFPRVSCPTPEWDQTVYKFNRSKEQIEFLWTIPSKDTCELMLQNVDKIVPEEQDLLWFVVNFNDGTLLRLSKKLNGEMADDIHLEARRRTHGI